MSDIVFMDDDLTAIRAVTGPVLSSPFSSRGDNNSYLLTQTFRQLQDNFIPGTLNTAYTDYCADTSALAVWADFILVGESPKTDIGGGVVEWTATFARVPEPREEPGTFQFNFPAFYPGQNVIENGTLADGRAGFQKLVPAKIVFEYFLVSDINDIEIIEGFAIGYKNKTTGDEFPPYLTAEQLWKDGQLGVVNTNPTREDYVKWFKAIDPTVPGSGTNPTMIVAQDSTIERWQGNIFARQTIKIWPE